MSSGHDSSDIKNHIKVYLYVFGALAILTVLTLSLIHI